MSIKLFKTLIAISEQGGFSAAANHICVSNAAVSQQMQRLEDMLHVKLFDRTNKTPRLNQLGKEFVLKAEQLVFEYDTILSDLTGDAECIGELTLGAIPSSIRALIPLAIKKLVNNYPKLHTRLLSGLSADLYDLVVIGAVDCAVLSKPAIIDKKLLWSPLADEELVLLTSPEIIDDDPIKILREAPYIRQTSRATVGVLAEQWLLKNNIETHEVMLIESLETITHMVAFNLGVSIVPNLCVPDLIFTSLRKIPLGLKVSKRTLGLLRRSNCTKNHLINRLEEEIKSTIRE